MDFEGTVEIARSPADVFALLADIQVHATGPASPVLVMEKIPPGPTKVGTRWREVIRLGGGMTMTIWSEVTAMEPDRLLAERFWGGSMRGTLQYTVERNADTTVLRQREHLEAVGPLRIFGWMIDRILPPRLSARLQEIRDVFEHEPATVSD